MWCCLSQMSAQWNHTVVSLLSMASFIYLSTHNVWFCASIIFPHYYWEVFYQNDVVQFVYIHVFGKEHTFPPVFHNNGKPVLYSKEQFCLWPKFICLDMNLPVSCHSGLPASDIHDFNWYWSFWYLKGSILYYYCCVNGPLVEYPCDVNLYIYNSGLEHFS